MRTRHVVAAASGLLLAISIAAPAAAQDDIDLRALYEGGREFADFLEQADQRRRAWHQHYRDGAPTDEAVEMARGLPAAAKLLVVAEDWCGDSVNTIPYLARLTEHVESLELRVIDSEIGGPLMRTHRTPDGRSATPTVILLDSAYNEIGSFVERPSALQEWFLGNEDRLPRGELYDRKYAWYDEDRGRETVREITARLATGLAANATEPYAQAATAPITPEEFLARRGRGDTMLLLDVRSAAEFADGHVPGAVNIPHTEIQARLEEVRAAGDTDVIVYCRSGRRAGIAESILRDNDLTRLLHLEGDMLDWVAKGRPVETGDGGS